MAASLTLAEAFRLFEGLPAAEFNMLVVVADQGTCWHVVSDG